MGCECGSKCPYVPACQVVTNLGITLLPISAVLEWPWPAGHCTVAVLSRLHAMIMMMIATVVSGFTSPNSQE